MMPLNVRQQVNVLVFPVASMAAVRWYKRALGARRLWGLGNVCGLLVEENFFSVGTPVKAQDAATGVSAAQVEVFVRDVDGFVTRALAAGADRTGDVVRDHEAPWGIQRRGGFTDPFGLRWSVSDRSPLNWHGPGRSHHLGYVNAVVDDLRTLDIKTGKVDDRSTDIPIGHVGPTEGGEPKRAAVIFFADAMVWRRWRWAESVGLAWDEEFGWTVEVFEDTNHGYTDVTYGLRIDPATEPTEVALRVGTMLESGDSALEHSPHRYRRVGDRTPALEVVLAAYQPT